MRIGPRGIALLDQDGGRRGATPARAAGTGATRRLAGWLASPTVHAALLVVAAALLGHAAVLRNGFVNLDDRTYITANPHVRGGLTLDGVLWALSAVRSSNWHPITWISHMIDVELWGLDPFGHHLSSLVLHALNALLVLVVLRRATGAPWRSAWVALVFAVHPLHVESVAWAAERKDVLSAALFWLTIGSYIAWRQRGGRWRYGAALVCFALGLMAKSMLVTLPAVLLLVDVWPLRRIDLPRTAADLRSWGRPLVEKLPFAALSVGAAVVTLLAQRGSGAVVRESPLALNAGNAFLSYVRYLAKAFWPADLAVMYPFHAADVTPASVGASVALLCACSALAIAQRERRWLLFGWGWFLVTLLPVAGFIRIGWHAYADRYTYIPLVGIYVIVVWGAAELAGRTRRAAVVVGAAAVLVLAVLTVQQQRRWESSITLFEHALRVTTDNTLAHKNLGSAYRARGDVALAKHHTRLGAMLQVRELLELRPSTADAHQRLGLAYLDLELYEEAAAAFREALLLRPAMAAAHNGLGVALARLGRRNEAIEEFRRAAEAEPDNPAARANLKAIQDSAGVAPDATP